MKEQDKTPEKQLNEMKLGNFSGKKKKIIIIKIMIVKVIQDLGKRMEQRLRRCKKCLPKT